MATTAILSTYGILSVTPCDRPRRIVASDAASYVRIDWEPETDTAEAWARGGSDLERAVLLAAGLDPYRVTLAGGDLDGTNAGRLTEVVAVEAR